MTATAGVGYKGTAYGVVTMPPDVEDEESDEKSDEVQAGP